MTHGSGGRERARRAGIREGWLSACSLQRASGPCRVHASARSTRRGGALRGRPTETKRPAAPEEKPLGGYQYDRCVMRLCGSREPAKSDAMPADDVAGCTSIVTVLHAGAKRAARAIAYRSRGLHRGRPTIFRSATISCCRSRASATSDPRERRRSATRPLAKRRNAIMIRPVVQPDGWHS